MESQDFIRVFFFIKSARRVLRGVEFPPEGLAEALGLAADAFQIIEVFGRNFFKHGTEVRHRHRREPVVFTGIIQMAKKKSHQFAPFGLALLSLRRLRRFFLNVEEHLADGFHVASMEAPRF